MRCRSVAFRVRTAAAATPQAERALLRWRSGSRPLSPRNDAARDATWKVLPVGGRGRPVLHSSRALPSQPRASHGGDECRPSDIKRPDKRDNRNQYEYVVIGENGGFLRYRRGKL